LEIPSHVVPELTKRVDLLFTEEYLLYLALEGRKCRVLSLSKS
jgi:hypothetical protein